MCNEVPTVLSRPRIIFIDCEDILDLKGLISLYDTLIHGICYVYQRIYIEKSLYTFPAFLTAYNTEHDMRTHLTRPPKDLQKTTKKTTKNHI